MNQPLATFYLCVAQSTPEAIRNMGSKPCYPDRGWTGGCGDRFHWHARR